MLLELGKRGPVLACKGREKRHWSRRVFCVDRGMETVYVTTSTQNSHSLGAFTAPFK